MELREQLGQLGLTEVTFEHNLSKEALFHESIANDRGRTRLGGPFTDQKWLGRRSKTTSGGRIV